MRRPALPSPEGATRPPISGAMLRRPLSIPQGEVCDSLISLHVPIMILQRADQSYFVDNILLPATTYNKEHKHTESDLGDDGTLLPFALDPNPAPGPSPLNRASRQFPDRTVGSGSTPGDGKSSRDYFNRPAVDPLDKLKENNSRSGSAERPAAGSPHIAFQEKGRQPSDHIANSLRKQRDTSSESPSLNERSRSQHASPAPASTTEAFKLQEVPKSKKSDAKRKDSDSSASPPRHGSPGAEMSSRLSRPMIEPTFTASPPVGSQDSPETASGSSFSSTQRVERPARGDSLRPSGSAQFGDKSGPSPTTPTLEHPKRVSSTYGAPAHVSAGLGISSPPETSRAFSEVPIPPARSADRRPPPADTFTSPRAPPQPPSAHKTSESISSLPSENSRDPYQPGSGLPRYSAQGDFSMDEDFARLLGNQEREEKEGGVFRRVSNAVHKHGRSLSERGSVTSRGGHKKWPTNGSIDISSPTIASPDSKEESVNLRNELRRAQQRIAELEAEKNGLQESMHSAADIKQANTVLREKRNTMAVLDTQREMVIRELEIMTEHLKHAKESNGSMDINQLKSDILKDFANSLHKLKDQLGGQIEDLISKRSELTDEISNLIQMKDKGFQEYESLTAQNAKLSVMYRELVENIQKTMNNKKGAQSFDASSNGLGIYNAQHRGGKSELSLDAHSHDPSFPHIHDGDSEATLAQPQVVNIRKTGKPTKFSKFKKGGQAFTTNVTKGFKGAFGSEQKQEDYRDIKVIGTPYGSVHQQPDIASMSSSLKSREDQAPKGWFGGGPAGGKAGVGKQPNDRFKPMQADNSNTALAADASTVLFGSDLSARCEFEKQMIPGVVTRCISEVELRGMDVEGVYRKSGGSSQVNQVRSGFEAKEDYDISDPDLDIHSVTSALKNYFRRLPVPLITFDVYDQFLEAGRKCLTQVENTIADWYRNRRLEDQGQGSCGRYQGDSKSAPRYSAVPYFPLVAGH